MAILMSWESTCSWRNTNEVVEGIIKAIPVSLAETMDAIDPEWFRSCVERLDKPSLVVCALGRTRLADAVNLMAQSTLLKPKDNGVCIRLKVEAEVVIVAVDWIACDAESELKALTFSANVAIYTVRSLRGLRDGFIEYKNECWSVVFFLGNRSRRS